MTQTDVIGVTKRETKKAVGVAGICALAPLVCVAIPMFVIRPFVAQGATALRVALAVRQAGPFVSGVCLGIALAMMIWGWGRSRGIGARIFPVLLLLLTVAGVWLTNFNIFEKMFHPYDAPVFAAASEVPVDGDDKVLAVRIGGEAHAYPVRTMGYHHVVNDVVGGVPLAATYCTLCHTGLVWDRRMDGRVLRFRLAGINNGNALIRDEQTGTIWQQSTGEGIFGPLKGRHLEVVHSDELTFALWRQEQPQGLVLKPDATYAAEYDAKDWERHVAKTRLVVDTSASGIAGHELMLGVEAEGKAKAYPMQMVLAAKVVEDQVGGVPVLLIVGPDGVSVRVFEARLEGAGTMTFVRDGDAVMDAETKSAWSFQGCAVSGALVGRCLKALESHKDYWFDWMNHHPATAVFNG